jgi:hypothetical protein
VRVPEPVPLRKAETDFAWVIVPFSRPENLNTVLCNFNRQKFPFKKLVLVENGRALGASKGFYALEKSALILTSEAHQSVAKNTAIAEIRKRGGGFCVTMDDDDWYGPQYLDEACGYAKTYDVIGKSRHFVSMDGNLWLCSRETANRPAGWLTGGTIACWAENAPEYPVSKWGEDALFCMLALKLGMTAFGTDIYHYLYRRSAKQQHAWVITPQRLREHESERCAFDLGHEDLRIVSGERLVDANKLLADREDPNGSKWSFTIVSHGDAHDAT